MTRHPVQNEFPTQADVVIIGGGIIGAATAFYTSRAGLDTIVVEMRDSLGSLASAASAGTFRALFDEPQVVALVQASIEVKPSYGLTDNEIETMLRDSMAHAEDDKEARSLREQQVEADRVIEALEAALAADGDALLSAAERQQVDAALNRLRVLARAQSSSDIKAGIEALEQACGFYVERRMNQSIQTAMSGHNVKDFE